MTCAALVHLGFSMEAAILGMGSLEELHLLTDDDVKTLCKVTCCSGSTMDNPNQPAPKTGLHAQIANPGIPVAQQAKSNLKLVTYYLKYKEKTSRVVTPASITFSNIHELQEHHDWEAAHKDIKPLELTLNWPRNMENLEEYLCGCLGVTEIPLSYIVRENPEVAPEAGDPVQHYPLRQDELITHALILIAANPIAFMTTYLTNYQCIWDKIMTIMHELDCWTYVHPTQHSKDGHSAYLNLHGHYLVVNNVDNMSTLAEAKLASPSYNGEKCHWNFEKYVKVHIDQHMILAGLVEHGYTGIDKRSTVHHLMQGIKTHDLDPVKM